MTEVDDFLAHYGVKGMKWGKRKEVRAAKKAAGGEVRTAKKAARGEVRREFRSSRSNYLFKDRPDGRRNVSKGKLAATMLIDFNTMGGASAVMIAKSTGTSTGKAAAIGIITGLPGALAYREIKVRKEANRRVGV